MRSSRWGKFYRVASVAALALGFGGACGGTGSASVGNRYDVPAMPDPMPGQAALGGHVLDANGHGVQGARVTIAETDATATADANGAYQFMVPADSTLTLAASASGMVTTYREAVVLSSGSMVPDFDILLLGADQMTTINTFVQPDQQTMRGVVALRLHSLAPSCTMAGAQISVFPPSAATVVYSAPSATAGGLDLPNATSTSVQAGTLTAAWLVSALPPGNMNSLRIDVQQAGCQVMAQSPSLNGLVFPGQRVIAAAALTQADLFLQ